MICMATYTAAEWEEAWEEYADALDAYSETKPNKYRRGFVRQHKKNARRLAAAKERLRAMDPEFCTRLEI